jgi:hypothetical protein
MTISTTPKGLLLPTSKPIPGGSPGAAAIKMGQQQSTSQAKLVNAVGGRRQRGGAGKVVVPQMPVYYNETTGKGQGVNDTIAQNSGNSMQATQNAKYDHLATKGVNGGARRKTKKVSKRKTNRKVKKTNKKRKSRRRGGGIFDMFRSSSSPSSNSVNVANCDMNSFNSISDPKQKKKTYKKCCKNWFKKNADKATCKYMKETLKLIPDNKLKSDTSGFRMPKGKIQPAPRMLDSSQVVTQLGQNYPIQETQMITPMSNDAFDPGAMYYNRNQGPILNETSQFEGFSPENRLAVEKASRITNNQSYFNLNLGSKKACDPVVDQYINNVNGLNKDQANNTYNRCCTNFFGNAQNCNLLKNDLKPFNNYYNTPIVGISSQDVQNQDDDELLQNNDNVVSPDLTL